MLKLFQSDQKFLFIALLSSLGFPSLSAMENPNANDNNNNRINIVIHNQSSAISDDLQVDRIMQSIENIDTQIEKNFKSLASQDVNGVVITLGLTGQGKSTLLNFLEGTRTVEAMQAIGARIIEVKNPILGMEVGHDVVSKTILPCFWHDSATKIVYFDSPGFADTGNENASKSENEIRNAYAIHKLFELFQQQNRKVLLAISEASINERASGLRETIQTMGLFFKNNIEELIKGTCLVVTKQDGFRSPEDVRTKLKQVYSGGALSYSQEALTFLKHLADHSQIAFFPLPERSEVSKALDGQYWQDARKNILDALKNTPYIQGTIKPTLAVSDATQNYAQKLATKIGDETTKFLAGNIAAKIYEYCKSLYQSSDVVKDNTGLKKLRDSYKALKDELEGIITSSIREFGPTTRKVFETCNINKQSLKKPIDYIRFLKKLNPNIKFPFKDWKDALSLAKDYVTTLGKDPIVESSRDNGLRISGFLVGTSDITKALLGRTKPDRIELYAFNTLWIDGNFTSHGTASQNATSLCLIAPCLSVVNEKVIDLSGLNGANGNHGLNGASPGAHGTDGTPGAHGGHGGHLFMKGSNFKGMGQLTVKTNGGNGGNGLNGGSGINGANGSNGNSGAPSRTENYWAFASNKENALFNVILGGDAQHEVTISGTMSYYENTGTDGGTGGNAGRGGAKGKGGKKGSAVIDGITWSYTTANGADGNDGAHGAVGIGGAHGQHCQGKVLNGTATWQTWDPYKDYSRNVNHTITAVGHVSRNPASASNGTAATSLTTLPADQAQVQQATFDPDPLVRTYFDDLYNRLDQNNPFLGQWK